ncbi:MAG: peptidyl-alpha-hydroxyglycine alpha-amidating lyase family protein [Nannocystaceae bacterium]
MLRARAVVLLAFPCACGTADAGPAAAPRDYAVVHGWPRLGEGLVLGQVAGVAIDSTGAPWIFHRPGQPWFGEAQSETIATPTLLRLDPMTGVITAALAADRFVTPHGLRIDDADHFWLTDVGLHQVFELSPQGEVLQVLGAGGRGTDEDHFDGPTDVAWVGEEVFVADGYGNGRVMVFDRGGGFVRQWGQLGDGPGEFFEPHAIVADDHGRLLVADRGNRRIQRFATDGSFLDAFAGEDIGRPWALDFDADGALWVVDGGDQNPLPPDRARVYALDLDSGAVRESFGSFGNYDGQLYWGHDLAVGAEGEIFVGDVYYGMRVQKFVRGG